MPRSHYVVPYLAGDPRLPDGVPAGQLFRGVVRPDQSECLVVSASEIAGLTALTEQQIDDTATAWGFSRAALDAASVPGEGVRPNEPAGYETWFEHDWTTWPTDNTTRMFTSTGNGMVQVNSPWAFELVADAGGPHGMPNVIRHEQQEGQSSGNTGGTFNLFNPDSGNGDSTSRLDQVQLQSVYRHHWVMFEDHPTLGGYLFSDTHNRTFWWNRHYTLGWMNTSLRSPASPRDTRHNHFRGASYWYYPCDGCSSQIIQPDDTQYAVGQWHRVETLAETQGNFGSGAAGLNDVRVRTWMDGALTDDRTTEMFIQDAFAQDHFAMVWLGGSGNTRPTSDYVLFGDIYISGQLAA